MKPKLNSFLQTARVSRGLTRSFALSLGVSFVSLCQLTHADTAWTGANSSDWTDTGNWNNGVPSGSTGLTIITNAGTAPILTGSSTQARVNVATGTLTVNGGALETTTSTGNWWEDYGVGIANGTVALSSGTITTNREVWVGYWGGTGTWTQTGGTANINSLFAVGNYEDVQGLTTGIATITNGTLNANEISVARGRNNLDVITATMTVNSGGIVNSLGDINVGFAGSGDANGTLTINNGGIVSAGTTGSNNRTVYVGRWDAVDATLNVNSGGTLNLQNGTDLRANNTGTKIINVDGGTIDGDANSTVWLGNATVTVKNGGSVDAGAVQVGTSSVTLTNGTIKAAAGYDSWEGATYLNAGGVIEASTIVSGYGGDGGHVFADGGTVRATQNQAGFINYWAAGAKFKIEDGGLTIDNAGFSISVTGSGLQEGTTTGGGLTLVGTGTTTLSANNTYTGATTVSAGTLFVSGSLGNTAVTVENGATIAGTGSILGSLNFDAGSKLDVTGGILSVAGLVSFDAAFGFDDLVGFDVNTAEVGSYTLISGSNFDFTNVDNFGLANALDLGGGKSAYFESGSLQVMIIPEPAAALLGGIGMLGLLRRRRA